MSKYIDAELLKAKLDEHYRKYQSKCMEARNPYTQGLVDALDLAEQVIDSLQQEHSEVQNGKFVFPKYLYARTKDNKTIDVSYAPQNLYAVEYIKNDAIEQPDVDLEKIIEQTYHDGSVADTSDMDHVDYENIARHFFELGQREMRNRITNPEYNAKVVEQLKSEYPVIKEE